MRKSLFTTSGGLCKLCILCIYNIEVDHSLFQMKQTRKRQSKSNTSEKLSVIRKAFSNRKSRRGIVGGAWSTKDLLTAMVKYGKTQSPTITVNVEGESTKSPEDIVKNIQDILHPPKPEVEKKSLNKMEENTKEADLQKTLPPQKGGSPISDNSKKQLTIILPFFLQIYESLYDDKNYEGSTKISRYTTIPNRAVMEYVVREIQKIEKTHPHPQLFESIFYFWNIFNLPTALDVMMAYLSEIPLGESSASRPGQVVTIVEKELGNTSSFQEWDKNQTKPHDFRVYTKVFGQKFNPFRYADGALLALTKYPFTTYNPHITRRDMEINVDKETGAFKTITNTSREPLPRIRGKNSSETIAQAKEEVGPLANAASPLATTSLVNPLTSPLVSVLDANLVTSK